MAYTQNREKLTPLPSPKNVCTQGRQQKNFQGGRANEKNTKNSTIKPLPGTGGGGGKGKKNGKKKKKNKKKTQTSTRRSGGGGGGGGGGGAMEKKTEK